MKYTNSVPLFHNLILIYLHVINVITCSCFLFKMFKIVQLLNKIINNKLK